MKLPYRIYRPTEAAMLAALAGNWIASYFFYRGFPAEVPIHWNAAGEVDGWGGPAFAAFFFPAIIMAMYLLMTLIPLIDPQKDRYKEFGRPYTILRLALVLYMTLVYFIASFSALGFDINISQIIPVGIGLLFMVIGNLMPKFKKNWFVGIRTPWTLSDERVWTKTHRVGGKLFLLGGLLIMTTALLPADWNVYVLLITVGIIVIGTVGYSYWIWRKLGQEEPK